MKKIILDGNDILDSEAFKKLEKPLIDLIAESSIWADPRKVNNKAVYPNVRRGNPKEKGEIVDGIRIDDNTYANRAIKVAISKDAEFSNYVTCHIWPGTTYDERYHTNLANLVLIPKTIASLSDHCPAVIDVLKYRAYELYGWYPEERNIPTRPEYYPENWGKGIKDFELSEDEPINLEDYLEDLNKLYSDKDSQRTKLDEYNENREEIEIEKVCRKVPNYWLTRQDQYNTKILNLYMRLSNNGLNPIHRDILKEAFIADNGDYFDGNYIQMKNFGLKNHGKVFEEDKYTGYVYLWEPVATFLRGLYLKK